MVGLAFAVAASANFPALLMAFELAAVQHGGSRDRRPVRDGEGSPVGWTLANPGIVSIPLGFIGCWLGTVLSSERGAEHSFHELYVRSETGLGAEKSSVHS
jgi:cation/acetate symporter